MKSKQRGAIHIPVVVAVLAVAAASIFFRGEISDVITSDAELTEVIPQKEDQKEELETQPVENELEEEVSIFANFIKDNQPASENPTSETPAETPASDCNLTQYMFDTESNMPYVGIISPLPEAEVDYPEDWPQDFIYPEKFKLVEYGMGKLTEDSAMMYKAFMLFESKPIKAVCELIRYFEAKDWEIKELVSREDLGFIVVMMDNDGAGTGLLNVEVISSDYSRSKISLSIFPDAVQSE